VTFRRKTKYGNKRATLLTEDGGEIVFDSQMELTRYLHLISLLEAGHIRDLTRQVLFPFESGPLKVKGKSGRTLGYKADFVYWTQVFGDAAHWVKVIEDVKGFRTPEFNHKWALAKACYPHFHFQCVALKKKEWEVTEW